MFEFNTYNHMLRFVLTDDGIEGPGYHCFDPSCDGVFMICIDTYIHFVSLMAMSEYEFFYEYRPTVYSWWLCRILVTLIHSV
jgi:hypothetical protein